MDSTIEYVDYGMKEYLERKDLKYPVQDIPKFIKSTELKSNSEWRNNTNKLKFGDFIFFQIINGDRGITSISEYTMSYPKLAIFTGYNLVDQAAVIEYTEPIRTWEWNFKPLKGYFNPQTATQYHIDWDDVMYIFKVWKHHPNWKELKSAYRKSFYFREDRKQKIRRIFNS